jgi:hypothetical protein
VSAFPHYSPAETEPQVSAAFAVGFSHAQIRTAIADLESGRTAFALSALQTTLAMLDAAMQPELRMPK